MSRAGWTAYALGVGFMTLTAAVMVFQPQLLISAFLDPADPRRYHVDLSDIITSED